VPKASLVTHEYGAGAEGVSVWASRRWGLVRQWRMVIVTAIFMVLCCAESRQNAMVTCPEGFSPRCRSAAETRIEAFVDVDSQADAGLPARTANVRTSCAIF
jgi:hypothetical protein